MVTNERHSRLLRIIKTLPRNWREFYFEDYWHYGIAQQALFDMGQELNMDGFTLEQVWEVVHQALQKRGEE